ncbi:MAG TPA: hypothetical protein VF961_01500, partial [Pyrinomonadaceae bacterium]
MKRVAKRTEFRVCLTMALRLTFALIMALVAEHGVLSFAQTENILPPQKSNLMAVHWPDLTNLEADVREQLTSLQSSL